MAVAFASVVSFFLVKFFSFPLFDTWLATATIVFIIIQRRNPKRVYLRWAVFCLSAIGGINTLGKLNIVYEITDTSENAPWHLLFDLGYDDNIIPTIILGILAAVLFVLDFRMRRKDK